MQPAQTSRAAAASLRKKQRIIGNVRAFGPKTGDASWARKPVPLFQAKRNRP
ncbi:hypothetical protein SAMN05192541_15411 [Bradyrhizobium arachidis]|nr:hypothetical protein SAMN05192541_15411 [Bradyrhizobium arachidis]